MTEITKYKINFGRFIHAPSCLVIIFWHSTSSPLHDIFKWKQNSCRNTDVCEKLEFSEGKD